MMLQQECLEDKLEPIPAHDALHQACPLLRQTCTPLARPTPQGSAESRGTSSEALTSDVEVFGLPKPRNEARFIWDRAHATVWADRRV